MKTVSRFFQSKVYRNFWKFTGMGSLSSGLLVFLSAILFWSRGDQPPAMQMALFLGLYGMIFGFFAAFVGFFIMYFMAKHQTPSVFSATGFVLGFVLASLVLRPFNFCRFCLGFLPRLLLQLLQFAPLASCSSPTPQPVQKSTSQNSEKIK